MVRDENYIHIAGWMLSKLHLSGNQLLAYAIIYGFSQDGESEFTGSISYLCEWLNVSRPTVCKALDGLVERGYVIKATKEINRVKFNTYKVNLQVVKNLYGGSKESLQGSKETLQGGSKVSLHNNTNIDKTNKIIDINYFDDFWAVYPKKKAKEDARKAWAKLKPDKALAETIIKAVKAAKLTQDWKKDSGKYIPHPATYLNGKRWEDEGASFEYDTAHDPSEDLGALMYGG